MLTKQPLKSQNGVLIAYFDPDKRTKCYKEVELAEDAWYRSAICRAAKDAELQEMTT